MLRREDRLQIQLEQTCSTQNENRVGKLLKLKISVAFYALLFLVLAYRSFLSNKNIYVKRLLWDTLKPSTIETKRVGESLPLNDTVVPNSVADSHALEFQSEQENVDDAKPITVAFAVTITHCPDYFAAVDAAAVLQKTVHHNSIRNKEGMGRYDYQMIAIYHPQASACASYFEVMGYELLERAFPVKVSEIRGEYLRNEIEGSGCCGERELIKLEIFNLTQYPLVVLTDLDVILLKPLDDAFDLMLTRKIPSSDDHFMYSGIEIPERIDLLWTADYTIVSPRHPFKPVQGGFVIVRPNETVYQDFVEIVREGDFREDTGWGGMSENFYGSLTFQGIMPYYFTNLYPGRSVELNWCIYNSASLAPWENLNDDDVPDYGDCWTNEQECEDCRLRRPEEIILFHFTFCYKPWSCTSHNWGRHWAQWMADHPLCRQMHHAWFNVRAAVEQSWGRSGWNNGTYDREHFYGSCTQEGEDGYIPIQKPYFQAITTEV